MMTDEPAHLNYPLFNTRIMQEICGNINEVAAAVRLAVQPHPNLARGFEMSPDGMRYTFHLRPDVRWHDGVPFTARDVAFSCGVMLPQLNPRSRNAFSHVRQIKVIDRYTLRFEMKQPFNAFLLSLMASSAPMMPAHIFRRHRLPHQSLQLQAGRHRAVQVQPLGARSVHPSDAQRTVLAARPAGHGRHLLPHLPYTPSSGWWRWKAARRISPWPMISTRW